MSAANGTAGFCRFVRRKTVENFPRFLLIGAATLLVVALVPAAHAQNSKSNPLCANLGVTIQASSGIQMACFGPQLNIATGSATENNSVGTNRGGGSTFGPNVAAASLAEDITPSGVRAFGQSEESVAASGPYVVEAWNDATGFFTLCGAAQNKEELTGFAFSNNGGSSFTDLGGLPNANCSTTVTEGDPSVVAYHVNGQTFFYIGSIFFDGSIPNGALSLTTCQVIGTGASATLSCGQPARAAVSSQCESFFGFTFCSFLDKDYMTLDAPNKRIYMSYTEFGFTTAGDIELAACDISNPGIPVCSNGSNTPAGGGPTPAYLVVSPGSVCEQEGAYPAVAANGDVYVAFENNWFTDLFNPFSCGTIPTQAKVVTVSAISGCLPAPPAVSSCVAPFTTNAANIISMDGAFIPGYNRFPPNDFPRIAVSDAYGTVSVVWNDSLTNPLGTILMQSYALGTLTPVQANPLKINNDNTAGMHFMPAVKNVSNTGLLNISWFDRRLNPTSALTDVFAATGVNPTTTLIPSNTRVTNVSTDWLSVSSDIIPNFGDYTDNFVASTSTGGGTFYVAWADGRAADPQAYSAHKQLTK